MVADVDTWVWPNYERQQATGIMEEEALSANRLFVGNTRAVIEKAHLEGDGYSESTQGVRSVSQKRKRLWMIIKCLILQLCTGIHLMHITTLVYSATVACDMDKWRRCRRMLEQIDCQKENIRNKWHLQVLPEAQCSRKPKTVQNVTALQSIAEKSLS